MHIHEQGQLSVSTRLNASCLSLKMPQVGLAYRMFAQGKWSEFWVALLDWMCPLIKPLSGWWRGCCKRCPKHPRLLCPSQGEFWFWSTLLQPFQFTLLRYFPLQEVIGLELSNTSGHIPTENLGALLAWDQICTLKEFGGWGWLPRMIIRGKELACM